MSLAAGEASDLKKPITFEMIFTALAHFQNIVEKYQCDYRKMSR